jgi:monoamine oxidase
MARTPLLDALQRMTADVAAEEHRTSRRDFLRDAAAAGAAASAFGVLAPRARAATPSGRVVVVGAGLAGLTAAYRLKQAGVTAEVHEASDRLGGRCWTLRGFFADGQIAEHGGELIDQGHAALRQLASELGLKLDNLLSAEEGNEQTNWFDGARYSYDQATADLKIGWQKLHKDLSAASYPTTFDSFTERGRQLDRMSIVDWINETFPGGINSRIGQLLDVAYNIEYGAESSEQSALNLIYLLGYRGAGNLRIFGASNEKYHVVGGNDQVPARLVDRLAGQITSGSELVAIRVTAAGRWELTFTQGSGTKTVTADRVVLALPFSIMRSSVNFSKAGWDPLKETAIREQGMGTNSKLHVQFTSRFWKPQGFSGETYTDRGSQSSWEETRAQPGASGILVNYTGGKIGASFGSGTPQSRAQQFLSQIEPVLPGATSAYNGRAFVDFWLANPWTKGSYSYWKVGQYTKFAGMEARRQGTCHFAGEHTSIDFQGYLNGAVETGERAADEILGDLK